MSGYTQKNASGWSMRGMDEQLVLSVLLDSPQENGWELSGLSPTLFADPTHRQIGAALCKVRDSGMRVCWRRVRAALWARKQKGAADLLRPLVNATGTGRGLTAAISRLMHANANAVQHYTETEREP